MKKMISGKHWIYCTPICLAGIIGLSSLSAATAQQTQAVRLTPTIKVTAKVEKEEKVSKKTNATDKATHKHDRSYRPKFEGRGIQLHTFCLANNGNLLACVEHPVKEKGSKKAKKKTAAGLMGMFGRSKGPTAGALQVYNSDFELKNHIPLPFVPTAVNVDQSGNIFVGGNGKIHKLDPTGQLITSCEAPSVIGLDKKAVRESIEAQQIEMKKMRENALKSYEKQIDKIEAIEEDKRTKRQKRTLKSYKMALEQMKKALPASPKEIKVTDQQVEMMVQQKGMVRAIAVDGDQVFIVCPARKGYNYTAWRMNSNLKDAKKVIKRLSGCCGQLDLQCHDGKIFVAENTKFRVTAFSPEGKKLSSFGKAARKGGEGFGSCCNPMNVRCTDNGDIITAESSIGKIKRFNQAGELVAYVGRARIGAGCKHVAVDFDSKKNRYYIQYEDKNEICVMDPVSMVGKTNREVEAEKAAAGLGKKLSGKWHVTDESWKEFEKSAPEFEKMMFANRRVFEFSSKGEYKVHKAKKKKNSDKKKASGNVFFAEDMMDDMFGNQSWSARKQVENRLSIEIEDKDGVITNTYDIEFSDDDHAALEMKPYGREEPLKLRISRMKK